LALKERIKLLSARKKSMLHGASKSCLILDGFRTELYIFSERFFTFGSEFVFTFGSEFVFTFGFDFVFTFGFEFVFTFGFEFVFTFGFEFVSMHSQH
tara:strand:- start:335 stop:625 length:291 start_codon:yes stop_codon:yes gene_type:complete